MKIIRYTVFNSNPEGNGAEKRTAQITEILGKTGIENTYIKENDNHSVSLIKLLYRAFPIFISIHQLISLSRFKNIRKIFKAIKNYLISESVLLKPLQSDAGVLLWECTRSAYFYTPIIAGKYHKKIIALPHNLESFVPLQQSTISLKYSPNWFNEEIAYLSKCDAVMCISKEETNLLSLFGINAFYLPYYPTQEVENWLLSIRENRLKKNTSNVVKSILMLGSADNQPTRLGMLDRLKLAQKTPDIKIIIAGYNTENIKNEIGNSENVEFWGSLEINKLKNLLENIDILLIHQPPTSGALTKISEMLIAGIPVLANFSSARNYYNIEGVYVYQNDNEYLQLLENIGWQVPPVPDKPINEINNFIKMIDQICN
jgi:glycosyltransferase involved in cell wall biosynthesis